MTKPRARRIADAVAPEREVWDRATELRADAEYALEQFEDSPEWADLSDDVRSERHGALTAAISEAREVERRAERLWREAHKRAEREIAQGE